MIITFQGSKTRGRNVGAMTVLVAATEAFRKNKKVLIMSLRDYQDGCNIEDYALPKEIGLTDGEGLLQLTGYTYSDTGLDAAIRRIGSGKFTPEQLDTCITPTVKAKNGLDILKSTKEAAFEKTINNRFEYIRQILETANSVYDYVFAYVPSTNNKFIEKLNEIVDKIIVVVRQGSIEDMASANGKYPDKVRLLVQGFEDESIWNEKKLRTMYDVKTIYKAPHNVRYNDAREDGDVIRFAMQNYNDDKNDYNYPLFSELNKLLDFIDDKVEPELFSFDEEIRLTREKKEKLGLRKYNPPRTEVVTEKKFFGLKTETYKKAVFADAPIYVLEDKEHDDTEEKVDMTPDTFEEGYFIEHHTEHTDAMDIEDLDEDTGSHDENESQIDNYDRTENKNEEVSGTDDEYSWLKDFDVPDDTASDGEKEPTDTDDSDINQTQTGYVGTTEAADDFDDDFNLDDIMSTPSENHETQTNVPTDMEETYTDETVMNSEISVTGNAEEVLANMGISLSKPSLKPYPEKPEVKPVEKPDTMAIDEKLNTLNEKGKEIISAKAALDKKAQELMNEVTNGNTDAMTEMQTVLGKTKDVAGKKQKLDEMVNSLNKEKESLIKKYEEEKTSYEGIMSDFKERCNAVDAENTLLMNKYNSKCEALVSELSNLKKPEIPNEPVFNNELEEPDYTGIEHKIEHIENTKAEIEAKKTELNETSKALLAEVSAGNMDAMSKMQEILNEQKSVTIKLEELENELKMCENEKAQMKEAYDNEIAQRKAAQAEYQKNVLTLKREYEEKRKAIIAKYN